MKWIVMMSLLMGSLIGQEIPFKGYCELQYRSDDLKWSVNSFKNVPVSKASWTKISGMELRMGGIFNPLSFVECNLPSMEAYLRSISLVIDGGVLVGSKVDNSHFTVQEEIASMAWGTKKGKSCRPRGGEFNVYLLQENRLSSCSALYILLGYAYQNRALGGQLQQAACDPDDGLEKGFEKVHYNASWHGPWIGVGTKYAIDYRFAVFADAQLHFWLFEGNFNFKAHESYTDRFQFDSKMKMAQSGCASGYKIKLGASYTLAWCLQGYLLGGVEGFFNGRPSFDSRTHHTIKAPSKALVGNRIQKSKGNVSIHWHSWFATVGLAYAF